MLSGLAVHRVHSVLSVLNSPLENVLREQFHILSGFYPGQREIIEQLIAGKRVLAIQRTGWGKSHVLPANKSLLSTSHHRFFTAQGSYARPVPALQYTVWYCISHYQFREYAGRECGFIGASSSGQVQDTVYRA